MSYWYTGDHRRAEEAQYNYNPEDLGMIVIDFYGQNFISTQSQDNKKVLQDGIRQALKKKMRTFEAETSIDSFIAGPVIEIKNRWSEFVGVICDLKEMEFKETPVLQVPLKFPDLFDEKAATCEKVLSLTEILNIQCDNKILDQLRRNPALISPFKQMEKVSQMGIVINNLWKFLVQWKFLSTLTPSLLQTHIPSLLQDLFILLGALSILLIHTLISGSNLMEIDWEPLTMKIVELHEQIRNEVRFLGAAQNMINWTTECPGAVHLWISITLLSSPLLSVERLIEYLLSKFGQDVNSGPIRRWCQSLVGLGEFGLERFCTAILKHPRFPAFGLLARPDIESFLLFLKAIINGVSFTEAGLVEKKHSLPESKIIHEVKHSKLSLSQLYGEAKSEFKLNKFGAAAQCFLEYRAREKKRERGGRAAAENRSAQYLYILKKKEIKILEAFSSDFLYEQWTREMKQYKIKPIEFLQEGRETFGELIDETPIDAYKLGLKALENRDWNAVLEHMQTYKKNYEVAKRPPYRDLSLFSMAQASTNILKQVKSQKLQNDVGNMQTLNQQYLVQWKEWQEIHGTGCWDPKWTL
jgi:hypothetical protein